MVNIGHLPGIDYGWWLLDLLIFIYVIDPRGDFFRIFVGVFDAVDFGLEVWVAFFVDILENKVQFGLFGLVQLGLVEIDQAEGLWGGVRLGNLEESIHLAHSWDVFGDKRFEFGL